MPRPPFDALLAGIGMFVPAVPEPVVEFVPAWDVRGLTDEGHLGSDLAWLGDIDADGLADLLVCGGAPEHDRAHPDAVGVRLLSGADGRVLWPAGESAGVPAAGGRLAVLDDLDVDGRPDFAVLDGADGGGDGSGAGLPLGVEIRSGRDGSPLRRLRVAGQDGRKATSLVAVPDIDGDGHPDLLVGATDPREGGCIQPPVPPLLGGAAWLFSSATGLVVRRLTAEPEGDGTFGLTVFGATAAVSPAAACHGLLAFDSLSLWNGIDPEPCVTSRVRSSGGLGFQLALAWPEVGADASCSVVVAEGGFRGMLGGRTRLAVRLLSGRDLATRGAWEGPAGEGPIRALAQLPDLDDDGQPELLVGASSEMHARGVVHVLSGRTLEELGRLEGRQPGTQLGHALAVLPDLGDGLGTVVALGAFGDRRGAPGGGAVWLHRVRREPPPR